MLPAAVMSTSGGMAKEMDVLVRVGIHDESHGKCPLSLEHSYTGCQWLMRLSCEGLCVP